VGQINPVPGLRLLDQTRHGFTAGTPFIRPVGAKKDVLDMAIPTLKSLCHAIVYLLQLRMRNQAAVYGRLIGNQDYCKTARRKLTYGFDAPRQKFKFTPALDIIRRITINDTVTVKKNHL